LWHQGCNKLINKRRSSRNLDPQTFHQQTAILRVPFVGVAEQQMGSLHAEDLVIQTPHHSDFFVCWHCNPLDSRVHSVVVVAAAVAAAAALMAALVAALAAGLLAAGAAAVAAVVVAAAAAVGEAAVAASVATKDWATVAKLLRRALDCYQSQWL
jgi:hypothetical protein